MVQHECSPYWWYYHPTTNQDFLISTALGNISRVQEILDNKNISIYPDFVDGHGMTATIWASKNGDLDIVRLFLNTFLVDVNKERKSDGATALILASYNGYSDVVL